MNCTACGSELILTNVVPDDTAGLRGVEHHTFVCSVCHVTERKLVFIKDGREADSPPISMRATSPSRRSGMERDEHVARAGLFGRVMARLRALSPM
jgi:hypothetical protein